MRCRALAVSAALSLLSTAVASPAFAQAQTGFAVDRFEPAERGSQFFVGDTLDFRSGFASTLRPAVGIVGDYAYKPLVVYDNAGNERTSLVRHQLFAHFGGSLVLFDRYRLALNVPVALYQDGETSTVDNETYKPADKAAIGDIRVAADVRLVGEKGDPFTLAAGARLWIPTGQRSQFTGDGSTRLGPQVLAAGEVGPFVYAARLAFNWRARNDEFAGSPLGSELYGAASAGIRAAEGKLVIGPELYASSVVNDGAFFTKRATPVEWLFGVHYDITKDLRLGGGVGGGARGYGSPQIRALFGFEWSPGYERPDRDHDGAFDDVDACPNEAGPPSDDPKKNGCPETPPPAPVDKDNDGIPDGQDACPDEAGPKTADGATNGCPDRDGDSVIDKKDACPDTAGDPSEDPAKNGCPPPEPPKDRDGDTVPDDVDACPDEPGPASQDPKKNGCPLVTLTDKEVKIGEQVRFKVDSAELLAESDAILEAVRKALVDHPELTKVRVEGHTDNRGDAAHNDTLSQKRAESVVKWLTDKGIDKKRLTSTGYGSKQPIDSNDTDEGRAQNRRVAFTIVEKQAPTPPAPAPQ